MSPRIRRARRWTVWLAREARASVQRAWSLGVLAQTATSAVAWTPPRASGRSASAWRLVRRARCGAVAGSASARHRCRRGAEWCRWGRARSRPSTAVPGGYCVAARWATCCACGRTWPAPRWWSRWRTTGRAWTPRRCRRAASWSRSRRCAGRRGARRRTWGWRWSRALWWTAWGGQCACRAGWAWARWCRLAFRCGSGWTAGRLRCRTSGAASTLGGVPGWPGRPWGRWASPCLFEAWRIALRMSRPCRPQWPLTPHRFAR
mmetsp:Transcript_19319/g.74078  ORF Transcript_19319/g.74078 Transcript_19319/m.74078 type:complete len:262 (+) Transcript_19319:1989-2774(+)